MGATVAVTARAVLKATGWTFYLEAIHKAEGIESIQQVEVPLVLGFFGPLSPGIEVAAYEHKLFVRWVIQNRAYLGQ
jgi:hypothetical protein